LAVECRLSLVDQTELVTAASERAHKTLIYGGGGTTTGTLVEYDGRRCVRLSFADQDLGIPDPESALPDGWSSGDGSPRRAENWAGTPDYEQLADVDPGSSHPRRGPAHGGSRETVRKLSRSATYEHDHEDDHDDEDNGTQSDIHGC
jgi:hypothetical protein